MSPKLTPKKLKKMGIPKKYWAGLILASTVGLFALGITSNPPKTAYIHSIEDGDTFVLSNNTVIRMIGINAPDRGEANYEKSKDYLSKLLPDSKQVFLEYDRYQDDPYGRTLAWIWIDCESDSPKFLPADYMPKSNNKSMPGLMNNPEGCKNGKLVNEELVKNGFAKTVVYDKRGELKYQSRLEKSL